MIMSSELTFFFKTIFPDYQTFKTFLEDFEVYNTTQSVDNAFAQYVYKILFRRYHNSNIQFDTIDSFKCEFANILEDSMKKYQKQKQLIDASYDLDNKEIAMLGEAIANQALNPNTAPSDITQPIEFISAQASTFTKDNKLMAYMRAIVSLPSQYIEEMVRKCRPLFKTIIPNEIFIFGEE